MALKGGPIRGAGRNTGQQSGVFVLLRTLFVGIQFMLQPSLGQNSSSIVKPIVDINPQDDIIDNIKDDLGLGSLDDGSFTDKWYFWLIIAIAICAFIVLVYFTLRGFKKYVIYRRKTKLENEIQVSDVSKLETLTLPDVKLTAEEIGRRTGRRIDDARVQHVAVQIVEDPLG